MQLQELLPIWAVVCPLVFLAGVVDAVVGGGGLISVPAYLLAGLPPHAATATNKCGNLFGVLSSSARFVRRGQYHAPSALSAAGAALVGAYCGARLNMLVPERYLYYVLLAVVPLLALFLLLKRDFGSESRVDHLSKRGLLAASVAVGFFIGGYDGFFGPGAGTFLILAFTALCGFDLLTASGNAKIINLASNLASFVTFALAGEIWWYVGLPAGLCSLAGAYLGSGLALKGGAKVIRPMFFVILALLLARLIWDLATR